MSPDDAPSTSPAAEAFARLSSREKAALCRASLPRAEAAARELVTASCRARGLDSAGPWAGGEWLSGPIPIVATLRGWAASLEAAGPDLRRLRVRGDGRLALPLSASTTAERLRQGEVVVLFVEGTTRGDLTAPSDPAATTAKQIAARPGPFARPALAALHALFVERRVAEVLLHPTLHPARAALEASLAPLVEPGFVRFVEASAGDLDALDPKPEPRLAPLFITPALYATDELTRLARRVASQNADPAWEGAASASLLVTAHGWPQAPLFEDLVSRALAALPARDGLTPRLEAKSSPAPAAPGLVQTMIIGASEPLDFVSVLTALTTDLLPDAPSAEIAAHTLQEEDEAFAAALERIAASLPVPVVGLSRWPGEALGIPSAPCFSQNTLGLSRVDKVIIKGSLRAALAPDHLVGHRRMPALAERLCHFAASPGIGALPGIAAASLRG